MTDEGKQIKATLEPLFAAAKAGDYTAFEACVTPDFFIHEVGDRLNAKGIFDLIVDRQMRGAVFVWNICDTVIHISGNLASVAYMNQGSITRNGETKPITWLETATLTRTGGLWRVAFMSSMRAQIAESGGPS